MPLAALGVALLMALSSSVLFNTLLYTSRPPRWALLASIVSDAVAIVLLILVWLTLDQLV